jgi:hypothetical protein
MDGSMVSTINEATGYLDNETALLPSGVIDLNQPFGFGFDEYVDLENFDWVVSQPLGDDLSNEFPCWLSPNPGSEILADSDLNLPWSQYTGAAKEADQPSIRATIESSPALGTLTDSKTSSESTGLPSPESLYSSPSSEKCSANSPRRRRKSSDKKSEEAHPSPNSKVRKTYSSRAIERKYRSKLTTKLDRLREIVPSLLAKDEDDPPEEELFGLQPTRKQNKATIFTKAVEYIEQLQQEHKLVQDRVLQLGLRVAELMELNEGLRVAAATAALERSAPSPIDREAGPS